MAQAGEILVYARQLTALEGSIREINTYAAAIRVGDVPDVSLLRAKHDLLEALFQQASRVVLALEGIEGAPERRGPLTNSYTETKATLLGWISERERAFQNDGPSGSRNNILDQTIAAGLGRSDHLPRIELPRFNGSPTGWLAFKGRFEKRISTLTEDADKYAFLGKCFEHFDPARHASEAFESSGLPFDAAWTKLEERFYKKRIAFEGYFFQLLRIKRARDQNPKSILGLIDAVDTMLSATKQIALQASELDWVANGLLNCIVKERLDERTLTKLEERLDLQKIYSWKELKSELEKIANQLTCKTAIESTHFPKAQNRAATFNVSKAQGATHPRQNDSARNKWYRANTRENKGNSRFGWDSAKHRLDCVADHTMPAADGDYKQLSAKHSPGDQTRRSHLLHKRAHPNIAWS